MTREMAAVEVLRSCLQNRFTAIELAVMAFLASEAFGAGSVIAIPEIVSATHAHRQSVFRALRLLQSEGVIAVSRSPGFESHYRFIGLPA